MPYKTIVFAIITLSAAAYSFVVYTDGTAVKKGKLNGPQAVKGHLLYQEYNCTACHQLYGLGGYLGPDLTNVMSAPGKGEVYVGAILQSGTSRMPNFHFSKDDIEALSAYLRRVDESGKFPIYKPEPTYWGDVSASR
jgi:nitric oxide reductase subunit C